MGAEFFLEIGEVLRQLRQSAHRDVFQREEQVDPAVRYRGHPVPINTGHDAAFTKRLHEFLYLAPVPDSPLFLDFLRLLSRLRSINQLTGVSCHLRDVPALDRLVEPPTKMPHAQPNRRDGVAPSSLQNSLELGIGAACLVPLLDQRLGMFPRLRYFTEGLLPARQLVELFLFQDPVSYRFATRPWSAQRPWPA